MTIEDTAMIQSESRKSRIKLIKIVLIILNVTGLCVGGIIGPMFVRIYYLQGGSRRWLSAWLLTAGFPVLLIPIIGQPFFAKPPTTPEGRRPSFILLPRRLIASAMGLGFIFGLCSYLYSFGASYLPVSVSAIIGSTGLAFTAVAAFIVVKHKFTPYSINAVALMMLGSIIIGIHVHGERPTGTSTSKYVLGILLSLSAAAIHGFLNASVEYISTKSGVVMSFGVLMQFQFIMFMSATVFCTIPILINGDFQAMPREAAEFGLGRNKYYLVLLAATLALQVLAIGGVGLIFLTSSLLAGIVSAVLVPVQQLFAVIFLHETFSADKGISLAVCLWAFASYFYGEYKSGKKMVNDQQEKNTTIQKEIAV